MEVTWIIQRNMGNTSSSRLRLLAACASEGAPVIQVPIVPFSAQMPALPEIDFPFVLYGHTTLLLNAYRSVRWREGVFFDSDTFRPSEYLLHYGDLYLNADMEVCSFAELAARSYTPNLHLFVKPNDDLKRFEGQVMSFSDFQQWVAGFPEDAGAQVTQQSEIAFCSPKSIEAEWRLFLVDGEVVAGSQYFPSSQSGSFVPPEVMDWGRQAARKWSPVPVFVMDVARSEQGLKLVELNCFNGSGFYAADVDRIVRCVSRFQESRRSGQETDTL